MTVLTYLFGLALSFIPVLLLHRWARRLDGSVSVDEPRASPAPFSWPAPSGEAVQPVGGR